MPPETTPVPDAKAILTPCQKRWLLAIGGMILSGLLARYGIPIAIPPLPAEAAAQIADTAATVKRIEAGQLQVMRMAGVPQQ